MKKLLKSRLFWLYIILAYMISLLFITFSALIFPMFQQFRYLTIAAEDTSVRFLSGQDAGDVSSDFHKLIFNSKGECIWEYILYEPWPLSVPDKIMDSIVRSTLRGRRTVRIYFEPDFNDLLVSISVPFSFQDGSAGASVAIRNMKNIPETLEGMAISFSILYIVLAIIFYFIRKRSLMQEALEENYVANVTHSLKAPIASVKALTEALVDAVPCDAEKQQPYFGMILKEVNAQSHMVQEILDLSRLQSGRIEFQKTYFSADECFSDLFEKYATYCEFSQIPFSVQDSIHNLPELFSDRQYINQLMGILLENAVKYVYESGAGIEVSAAIDHGKAVFCVYDDGSAIPAKDLPNVFHTFYTGENAADKNSSGMGLAIAKAITDSLKERIWIESSEKKGTSIYFTVSVHS